ncbi:MAG: hypothetical protein H0W83_09125, partial [Planctomycetes bacterium]|nr:hypothetical protein [Planctomycetota bacterium]
MILPGVDWSSDLSSAITAASIDRKPVLVLVRDDGDVSTIDCAIWLRDHAPLRPLLARFHPVVLWNRSSELARCIAAPGSGLLFMDAAGQPIAIEEVPGRRAQLAPLLEDVLAHPETLEACRSSAMAGTAAADALARMIQR